jgi:DNA repair protein RadA/Sms
MATIYRCGGYSRGVCEHEAPVKWRGPCPGCGRMYDILVKTEAGASSKTSFANLAVKEVRRYESGTPQFDRVLGGGLVKGSPIVIAGPPKTGKSTLLVQIAAGLSKHGPVLYVSGEQSAEDVGTFVHRVGVQDAQNVELRGNLGEAEKIIEIATELKPIAVIVDSAQTTYYSDVKADAGSSAQMRAIANGITEFAKEKKIAFILVAHVTKDGDMAGPKVFEHLVDAIVYFEPAHELDEFGDIVRETENYRSLSCSQNRFASGPGTFTELFEMTEKGVKPLERRRSRLIAS